MSYTKESLYEKCSHVTLVWEKSSVSNLLPCIPSSHWWQGCPFLTEHLLSAVTYLLLDLLIAWMCRLYLDTVHVQMYMHIYMVPWEGTCRYDSGFGRRCVSVTLKGHPGAVTNLSVLPLRVSLSLFLSPSLQNEGPLVIHWLIPTRPTVFWVFFLSLHLLLYAVAFRSKCAEVLSMMGHSPHQ